MVIMKKEIRFKNSYLISTAIFCLLCIISSSTWADDYGVGYLDYFDKYVGGEPGEDPHLRFLIEIEGLENNNSKRKNNYTTYMNDYLADNYYLRYEIDYIEKSKFNILYTVNPQMLIKMLLHW